MCALISRMLSIEKKPVPLEATSLILRFDGVVISPTLIAILSFLFIPWKSETTSAPRPFLALSFTKANCPFVKLPA